jgi:hypothetical protein
MNIEYEVVFTNINREEVIKKNKKFMMNLQ